MTLDAAFSPDLVLRDHFYANDAVADATIGELDWEIVTIGNASTYAQVSTTALDTSSIGVIQITTAGTADGDGSVIRLAEDALVVVPGMAWKFRVRYPDVTGNQLAGNNLRFGFQDSVTATAPTVGIYALLDAGVITLHADSAGHGDNSVAVTDHPDLTSGTTAVLDQWLTIEARAAGGAGSGHGVNAQGGPGNVVFTVTGPTASRSYIVDCEIDDDEEVEFSLAHWQDTGGAATLDAYVDYAFGFIPHPAGRNA